MIIMTTKMYMQEIKRRLKEEEAIRVKPYDDADGVTIGPNKKTIKGKLTGGVGRNLEDNGFRPDEIDLMLTNDINAAVRDVKDLFPGGSDYVGFDNLDSERQYVLVSMCFNMGKPKLAGFKKMFAALAVGRYEQAAAEMLDSVWKQQVGPRAEKLSKIMRTGEIK
ncbi:lysozyme [Elusimicrobium simillimum]|uniref:glycoside hydrolase family protein n=1 Tax=Elusimicrobium simillimum TaxID=3143438 RepID=UPI003C6F2C15